MSGATQALANPFEATAPDEDVELRALARSLRFAQGFRLFFARSQDAGERRRLVEALAGAIPSAPPLEVHFDQPIVQLLDELRRRLPEVAPPFISIWGLEASLPRDTNPHATPMISNLNAARDSFPQYLTCPLVLWVQPYALTAIARGAPDFFSIRSGVYDFATPRDHPPGLTDTLASPEYWEMANLPPEEKLERVDAISELLARYRTLPPEQRDRQSESRLLNRLGPLLTHMGRWSEAEVALREALEIDHEISDHIGESETLNNLGIVYDFQGRWGEAVDAYQQSLEIKRELNERAGEGATLNNLGKVYRAQGRWAEAVDAYRRSLEIMREFNDRVGEGATLNNLGIVYYFQSRWDDALDAYQQSLEIKRGFKDRVGEGRTLNNLGAVYGALGRWGEAVDVCLQSLAIWRELKDRVDEGRTLTNLALFMNNQGKKGEAIRLVKEGVTVLEGTEAEADLKKARQILTSLEREAEANVKNARQILAMLDEGASREAGAS